MVIGELLSEGKSKRVYTTDDPALAVVCFKDEAQAFHGLKRGEIFGKGAVNNAILGTLYGMLAEKGVENHFVEALDKGRSIVRRCEMIPLLVKVRNRAAGSLAERLGIEEGTALVNPVVEFVMKDEERGFPLLNEFHILALQLANEAEIRAMTDLALRINAILAEPMRAIGVELIDFKLEFGRCGGRVILADEISPDTARFWDTNTHEPMDIDRFKRDLGDTEAAYREILRRMLRMEDA